jgi:hypothetical protein
MNIEAETLIHHHTLRRLAFISWLIGMVTSLHAVDSNLEQWPEFVFIIYNASVRILIYLTCWVYLLSSISFNITYQNM